MGWLRRRSADSTPPSAPDPGAVVRAYHAASMHRMQRFAAGPGELDWATQPDPYRRYAGAELAPLAKVEPTDTPLYEPSFCAGQTAPVAPDARALGQFFFDALALSATKRWGAAQWALRCNPSSGNLHPTEGWIISGPVAGLRATPFVAHYAPREHALEVRADLDPVAWRALSAALPGGGFFVALTSIHWREAWKYGERAYRYCQHDVGHAIGALSVSAAALGWRAHVLDDVATDEIARLLGVHDQRGPFAEVADALLAVAPAPSDSPWRPRAPSPAALAACSTGPRSGIPNDLSAGWIDWDAIEVVSAATRKPRTEGVHPLDLAPRLARTEPAREPISLRRIVRSRRSAVAFDGRSGMTRDAFFQTLARTLPREGGVVLDVAPFDPLVDLVVFVHRVQDVEPGLYLALRDRRREARWRAASRLVREAVAVDSDELLLLQLRKGDLRAQARAIACQQEIAADGCFALAMLADMGPSLPGARGPWMYPRLFWECGWIGQLLYLEAEALGLRGTGIGCFFDDGMHSLLALENDEFRSLYHFTLGAPVADPRIVEEPAYAAD